MNHSVMLSHQQNSLKNWKEIWRPQVSDNPKGYVFLQKNGKPFPTEDALRMFLLPYCKPIWKRFSPKVMRDWHAIAYLIRTKEETKKWDTRQVTKRLGHKHQDTTEDYIEYAEDYYKNDKYDWLRAVLKFHPNSRRMQKLMKQEHGSSRKILTNKKNKSPEVRVSSVGFKCSRRELAPTSTNPQDLIYGRF